MQRKVMSLFEETTQILKFRNGLLVWCSVCACVGCTTSARICFFCVPVTVPRDELRILLTLLTLPGIVWWVMKLQTLLQLTSSTASDDGIFTFLLKQNEIMQVNRLINHHAEMTAEWMHSFSDQTEHIASFQSSLVQTLRLSL